MFGCPVAEFLATGLTYQSLQKNTLTKIAVMPVMLVYVLLAIVFAAIIYAIPNVSEAILHIGEAKTTWWCHYRLFSH
ncbi:hypothetical protein MGH68_19140 [Erysipelothrix sp. D19-032]